MKRLRLTVLFVLTIFAASLLVSSDIFITSSSPSLQIGDKGAQVEELQQRLSNLGLFTGSINGEFDLNTISAVRRFQEENSLQASGIADKDTMIALGMTRIGRTGVAYAEGNSVGDTQLLARAINGEARGEPYEGQVAVGAVILNRTRDPRFPKTIAGVIYQPGAFTAVDDGQINTPLDPNSTVVKAAGDALNGWDPTNGCVYYWNPATATSKWIWSRQIVTQIGKHYFGK